MSDRRKLAVLAALGLLAVVLAWQYRRDHLAARCEASGGVWSGRASSCDQAPASPILEREGLRRT